MDGEIEESVERGEEFLPRDNCGAMLVCLHAVHVVVVDGGTEYAFGEILPGAL